MNTFKLLFVLALLGCASDIVAQSCKSAPELQPLIESINLQLNSTYTYCETDNDCTVAVLGCPFGCGTPVNKQYEQDLLNLVGEYHAQSCMSCDYACPTGTTAACLQNRCRTQTN